jgi:predicted RNase H-like nuclease (RuvC/YqgF family)
MLLSGIAPASRHRILRAPARHRRTDPMAARRTTGARRAPSTAESIRGFGVVLERVESQMAAVLEAVTSSSDRLDARIDTLEARLSERIAALEQVVRAHSERISGLENEVARLRHDFDHREERGRMEALELRVAALETRLGVAP